MKTEKNIFVAFILNLLFSMVELVGGIFTGSIAIVSDAVHDFGDAVSIGASFFFEKKSKRQPNERYNYGYARFSVLGGVITTVILLVGSALVIYNAIRRFLSPVSIDYNGMLILAVVGLAVNLIATHFTHGGGSINQKAVNLHMLEDALGWVVILIGAIVIRFTEFYLLDPMLSILVAVFVLVNAMKNLKEILDIFLIKTPKGVNLNELKAHILGIEGVEDVHHLHVWTLDGESVYATLHVESRAYDPTIKTAVKEELKEHGVSHATVEMEICGEGCQEKTCVVDTCAKGCAHHHHHHH